MERDGNVLLAIIERQAERARAPSRWDGTERKRHLFLTPTVHVHVYLGRDLGMPVCPLEILISISSDKIIKL